MITKEQITEILNNHAGYIDRSRTEQAVHEDNFNDVADEILSKLSQHEVSKSFYCLGDSFGESGKCDKQCEDCKVKILKQ
jgi:hypothetical protein